MPEADGKAKVTGHTGRLAIDASLHHLKPARDFGPEYLTYVLWAITPEGRATNLGEVVPNGDGTANRRRPLGIPTVKVAGSLQRNTARDLGCHVYGGDAYIILFLTRHHKRFGHSSDKMRSSHQPQSD